MTISYAKIYTESNTDRNFVVRYMERYAGLAVRPIPDLKVLDFGCATGCLLEALIGLCVNCEGVDICQDQIHICQEKKLPGIYASDSIDWVKKQIESGIQWNSIYMLDVLEHIPAEMQIELIGLIFHALPPGGRLILKLPNPESIAGPRMMFGNFTHCFTPTSDALSEILRIVGFRSCEVRDEIPWATHTFKNTFASLLGANADRRRLKYDLFYLFSQPIFRWFRRLALASEIGLETAFRIPMAPNYLCIATK